MNLQIICLPIGSAVPIGYQKFERGGRAGTRSTTKKFDYYVKIEDAAMSEASAYATPVVGAPAQNEMGPNIQNAQVSAHDSQMSALANFLGGHMKMTEGGVGVSPGILPVGVNPLVANVNIAEEDISDLFSRLTTTGGGNRGGLRKARRYHGGSRGGYRGGYRKTRRYHR